MHFYELLIIFTIATIGLCIPLKEPERCCIANQFSSKYIVVTAMILPDGSTYKSYVSSRNRNDRVESGLFIGTL